MGASLAVTPGTILEGRYRILARIGEGGYGIVYKARDRHKLFGNLVAIKVITLAALSPQEQIEATDTFNREITLLSGLKHRNLPHICDRFTDAEHWYIVMDYIDGLTLENLLTQYPTGRIPLGLTTTIALIMCDVLAYLHQRRPAIIFRDVKPGNIMLTRWGRLYLIDFGIARRYRAGELHDTGPLGSPGYAAPEQYGRMQTTPQADIYGLGATIQTLLTGKEPLEIRLQGIPSDVRMPVKLHALLNRMMESDPGQRPASMDEVKSALLDLNLPITPFIFPDSHRAVFLV
jgi:serine/threonine protein kinase